jgi:hypothetical protein
MATPDNTGRPPTPTTTKGTYTISPHHDLTILVESPKDKNQRSLTRFQVEKSAVTSFSQYFESSLRFNTKFGHEVKLEDDDAGAIRVWLIYMHDAVKNGRKRMDDPGAESNYDEKTRKADEDQESLFNSPSVADTDITRVWHIINVGDKYLFDISLLHEFFKKWYAKHVSLTSLNDDADFARQLAFPCYMFDHAEGFSAVTRWLAYNFGGHITEKRPVGIKYKHMHLCPPDFVGEYSGYRALTYALYYL